MSDPKAPGNGGDPRESLLHQVQAKRNDVDRYLAATSRRRSRLVQVTIIAGAIAAALTASAALGGQPFATWLTETLALQSPSWRILCAVAAVCSAAATIATQLHKSNNYDEHIARAQGVRTNLEALEVGIRSGHLDRQQATSQFIDSLKNASFIDPVGGHPGGP